MVVAVTCEGTRDILRLWAGKHGDGEVAKFWMRILAELRNHGVNDALMVVCDGLKSLPEVKIHFTPAALRAEAAPCNICAGVAAMPFKM